MAMASSGRIMSIVHRQPGSADGQGGTTRVVPAHESTVALDHGLDIG